MQASNEGISDPLKHLKYDVPAGLVVFLVALPLCMGIALASGAPVLSGLAAGIIGGLIVPLISRSQLSVCGPAAGLTAIVLSGAQELGSYEAFLAAVFLAGVLQAGLGFLRAGGIGALVPSSVIKGMLAAIGLILILKQLPHAVGYDVESFGSDAFLAPTGENTFSLIVHALGQIEVGALIISVLSLATLIIWPKTPLGKIRWLPGALVVVVMGTLLNIGYGSFAPNLQLQQSHLVYLPAIEGPASLWSALPSPDLSALTNPATWTVAVTVGLVASIETLLCVEAVDGMDPYRRVSPTSRELVAQGVANVSAGLIGALPITSVIVRSSANIGAGGRTRASALVHGIFLLAAVMFLAQWLSLVPLACLAAILLQVGYKLARPELIMALYRRGGEQFVPFAITVVAILLTDLLRGVLVGLVVGLVYVLRNKTHRAFTITHEGDLFHLKFNKDVSFIHVPALVQVLRDVPDGTTVRIDAQAAGYVDFDIQERIEHFLKSAEARNLTVEVRDLKLQTQDPKKVAKTKVQPVVKGSFVPPSMVGSKESTPGALPQGQNPTAATDP